MDEENLILVSESKLRKLLAGIVGDSKMLDDIVLELTEDPPPPEVDALAALIRRVDGNHSLGAAELAEAILKGLE